jgi:hypothetical protein
MDSSYRIYSAPEEEIPEADKSRLDGYLRGRAEAALLRLQDDTSVSGAVRYRKKPVEVEAVQLSWQTWNEVCEFLGDTPVHGGWVDPASGEFTEGNIPPPHLSPDDAEIGCLIPTLEGDHLARQGDWIIKGVKGEFYPCKPDIFEATYEFATQPTQAAPTPTDKPVSPERSGQHAT